MRVVPRPASTPGPQSAYFVRPFDPPMSDNPPTPQAVSVPSSTPLPAPTPTPVPGEHHAVPSGAALAKLALGALGVVYGDIGTSPLYAVRECFSGTHAVPATPDNVLGILSLVFWAMTFVVTVKYLWFVMRADNRGEGGILALMALVGRYGTTRRSRGALLLIGLFGARSSTATGSSPPPSRCSARSRASRWRAPAFHYAVVPASVAILVLLFLFQKRGTATVGAVFGPVMLVWFVAIAVLGARGILLDPAVLGALSPVHAATFFVRNGGHGFLVLGAVVLVITGGEALYADMGHFGRRPIRVAWFAVAMPALLLNYLGQGALLLHDPSAARNPFYLLAPSGPSTP